MSVYEIMELFIDDSQVVELYDTETETVIYAGEYCEMPDEFGDREVCSIDNIYKENKGVITLNLD